MTYHDIVSDVIAQLLDLEDVQLAADTALVSLQGWDSVNALRVLVYLERETGQSVDYNRFMAAETLGDVALSIKAQTVPA